MISIQQLSVKYGLGKSVLNQLDLELTAGKITALAAPNGEGKTTLLKVMCGLRFPQKGKVDVLGFTPSKRDAAMLEQLYFLPAEPNLPAWTPEKIGRIYGPCYPRFSDAQYQRCLNDFSVDPKRSIGKLSTGQQRRVQLAFALAVKTPLLLLDEPTLGLDIAGKDQFRRSLIQSTDAGQTVIIASHQLAEIAPVLDDLLILREGRIYSQINIAQAFQSLSFTLTSKAPTPYDGTYGRRVPGGWLVVNQIPGNGNAQPDLETLYLALTEGELKLNTAKLEDHV